ncbi:MAG TPA: hypothetical protein PLC89_08375 [Haliscomenobacter sp.]|uniref:hypothetical protein n=1 Tax=Haliscomenobacter sp. TaxID=2717303 RepID=UPI002C5671F7|nr:hypothetical protein [Haliscomenobacter sp.]HOY17294.1 hypothetical protein [Haliscomenobacter sp.]
MDFSKLKQAANLLLAGKVLANYSEGLKLIENGKYAEAKTILQTVSVRMILSDGVPLGICKEELYSARGYAEFGLGNYSKANELFKESINIIEKYGFENSSIKKQEAKIRLSNLYAAQGKTIIFLGEISEGVSYLIKSFNTDNNNIESLFYIITLYAKRNEVELFDFYTKEIAKCYNDEYPNHRKSLHYHTNNNTIISGNKTIYERFLRTLRSFNLIDDHFLHSKIGRSLPQNTLSAAEKQKILNEIVQNNISSAFELLLFASKNKPDVFNSTMLLFNNYNKVVMEVRIGVIAKDDENLILNKIKLSMIQLSNDL